jgi:MATE family multidrug resistance protein
MTLNSPTRTDASASAGLRRQLIVLALPVLGERLLTFCVNLFDVYLSGRLGKSETAAIGVSGYVSWLASMIFALVGTGTSAIVAREWGAGRHDEARRIAGRSLTMVPFVGVCVFVLLQLMASGFARLLNMDGEQLTIAVEFLRIDACGQFFAGWTLIAAAASRGSGDFWTPLRALILTNMINVAISSMLTFGITIDSRVIVPPMGARGIVLGTTSAHICSALFITLLVMSKRSRLSLRSSDFGVHRETILRVLRIGGPAAIGGLCTFVGHFSFLMIIARLSTEGFDGATFAAHVVGVRIEALSYLPIEAFGIATATLVGQNLGADQVTRAKRVGREAITQSLWYAGLMSVTFFLFAPQIYAVMHSDPAVAAAGAPAFRLMALYQIPNALLIICFHALTGAGDTRFPLMCSLLGNVIVRVSVGYFFGIYCRMGLLGAWMGMGADNILRATLMLWRYMAGRWTDTKV